MIRDSGRPASSYRANMPDPGGYSAQWGTLALAMGCHPTRARLLLWVAMTFGGAACAQVGASSNARPDPHAAAPQCVPGPTLSEWEAHELPPWDDRERRAIVYGEREDEHCSPNDHTSTWQVEITGDDVTACRGYHRDPDLIHFAVADGELVALDRGEFGAAVYFTKPDGTRELLVTKHVQYFHRAGDAIYGVGGLAHMGHDAGHVLRFSRDAAGGFGVAEVADLIAHPAAFTPMEDGRLLIATGAGLQSLDLGGRVELLHRAKPELPKGAFGHPIWTYLRPSSLVATMEGTIFIGMADSVVELTPDPSGQYHPRWLVPPLQVRRALSHCRPRLPDGRPP